MVERVRWLWQRSLALKIGAACVLVVGAGIVVLLFFPWDVLRLPLNRYVSEHTGRKFEVTRHLDVNLGWHGAVVQFDGLELANPSWARDPYLVRAQRAEFEVSFWPLLAGKIVIPRLALVSPALGLELKEDGRRTWAFSKNPSEVGRAPTVGQLRIDAGSVDFVAAHLGVDLHANLGYDRGDGALPLTFKIDGRYRGQPLTAHGRTGNVLQINAAGQPPFPVQINVAAGETQLNANGTVAELAGLDGIDAHFQLKGQTLGALFPLLGIALPQTSPYALQGQLRKLASQWDVLALKGQLGLSDVAGDMHFDQAPKLPLLTGHLQSRAMDMDDLGPLIGLPPTARSVKAVQGVTPIAAPAQQRHPGRPAKGKVLPTAPLDFERLRAMNADLTYTAASIRNVHGLPLDSGSVHVKLNDGVLTLDPLELGVAGGKVAGAIRIDATQDPADIRASLDLRALQINRLVPKVETLRTSLGKLDGRVNLSGRGTSVASWLGNSSGDVAALTGRGRFSSLLLELMGLDGAEIARFLLTGDQNVTLRCGAVAFDVDKGIMTARSMVFDTDNTVFDGAGHASLKNETLDFVIHPQPKHKSILSLRTPLVIGGTFAAPKVGVKVAPLVERGLAALALGVINPLLALAATVETGPGEDADCRDVLARAVKPSTGAAAAGAAKGKTARE